MDEATLRAIQTALADGFHALFGGAEWTLPKRTVRVYRFSPPAARETRFGVRWDSDTEVDSIVSSVIDLVLRSGNRLRACRHCGRVFVATMRQQYCSAVHSQAQRNLDRKVREAVAAH